jgi:nicotinic acetylcholine receptor
MARPGEKITRKTIMMQNKMKELDLKERSSKSLLANVLDMDDDLRPSSTLPGHAHIQPHHPSHAHSSAPGGAPPPVLINNVGGIPTTLPSHMPSLPFGGGGFTRITPGLPALPPGFTPGTNSLGGADPDSTGNSIGAMNNVGSMFPTGIQRELSMILKEIRVITDKIRDEEDTAAIENDWKFAAMVLDRLCLITFTLFTFIATIAVLLTAPHIIVS